MAETLGANLETKLKALELRAEELSTSLGDPDVTADMDRFRTLSRSYAELQPLIQKFGEYRKARQDLEGARELLASADRFELNAHFTD